MLFSLPLNAIVQGKVTFLTHAFRVDVFVCMRTIRCFLCVTTSGMIALVTHAFGIVWIINVGTVGILVFLACSRSLLEYLFWFFLNYRFCYWGQTFFIRNNTIFFVLDQFLFTLLSYII